MSEYQTPIGPMFELQREAIKRGADILQFPRTLREEVSEEGLQASRQAGTQLIEASRGSLQRSLALAAGSHSEEGDHLRETVDSVFDGLRGQHEAAHDTVEETYEQTERQAQIRSAEQLTNLLNLNRRLEDQLVTAVEQLEERATRSDEVAGEVTEQIEQLSEQLDRQAGRYADLQGELQAMTNERATGESEVRCRVCGNTYGAITYSHLQTHDMTVEEYRSEFGSDVPM